MTQVTRRTLMKGVGAAATLSMIGAHAALAQEKVKVGFIFLGPIGDYGWTWAHNKGREAIDAALGDKVETVYVENVAEDASAIPVIRDLAQQGCKLIFTTSYGYMDQTLQVASLPYIKAAELGGSGDECHRHEACREGEGDRLLEVAHRPPGRDEDGERAGDARRRVEPGGDGCDHRRAHQPNEGAGREDPAAR